MEWWKLVGEVGEMNGGGGEGVEGLMGVTPSVFPLIGAEQSISDERWPNQGERGDRMTSWQGFIFERASPL